MSFDLEEPAMFKMGGVMGGAYVHSIRACSGMGAVQGAVLMKRMK